MQIIYLPKAEDDLSFWIKSGNKTILRKITDLTKAIIESPFTGIGKPEQLKYQLGGLWSRRISGKHRYVYEIDERKLYVYSLKGHY